MRLLACHAHENGMKLLFLSTPVGPLGSGQGGGVELTVRCLAAELQRRGHELLVLAPAESQLPGVPIEAIAGQLQIPAQTQSRDEPVVLPADSALANMWARARVLAPQFDLTVNFAFDWLPFYLTSFFPGPIAHFISMGSLNEALDRMAGEVAQSFPGTLGVYTQVQAKTFPFAAACQCLGSGIDLAQYQFNPNPEPALAWLGRIAPEKALEDAAAAATAAGLPLRVYGKLQDRTYWERICQDYPAVAENYGGFLDTATLQAALGRCQGLLMTPRWVEAFGNVAIEALACGVPVIAYRRGGPAEIVRDGETGFLVEPDDVAGLTAAIARLGELDRAACRRQADREYSLHAFGDRFENWFTKILAAQKSL